VQYTRHSKVLMIYMLPKYSTHDIEFGIVQIHSVHDFVLCLTILKSSNTRLREGLGSSMLYGGGQEVHVGSTNRHKVLSHHEHSRERA
jgi:hypothetical protein